VFNVELPDFFVRNNPSIINPIIKRKKKITPELNGKLKLLTNILSKDPIKLAVFGIRIPWIRTNIKEEIIKAIVDKPDEVEISLTESENTSIYELKVGEGDVGKVIGKKGKNIGSIRTLLSAATAKAGGKRALLEIIE